jgi:hypothetical protein
MEKGEGQCKYGALLEKRDGPGWTSHRERPTSNWPRIGKCGRSAVLPQASLGGNE